MATFYIYSMTVWLTLEHTGDATKVAEQLMEVLGESELVSEMESIEDENEADARLTFSFQVQLSFPESDCDDDQPTESAVAVYEDELEALLARHVTVVKLELLDDALTTFLLGEHEDEN